MRPYRRHYRKPKAEINVVPYIDVTLVLLIIFMVTAPLLQSGVDVELPKAESRTLETTEEHPPIIVSIDRNGELYLEAGGAPAELLADDRLTAQVLAAKAQDPEAAVFLRGDEAVDYGRVVVVMAALKNAGIPNVGLMTRLPEP